MGYKHNEKLYTVKCSCSEPLDIFMDDINVRCPRCDYWVIINRKLVNNSKLVKEGKNGK